MSNIETESTLRAPDNVVEEIEEILEVVGDVPFWIDAETLLRSPDDHSFDLSAARRFLMAARPHVRQDAWTKMRA